MSTFVKSQFCESVIFDSYENQCINTTIDLNKFIMKITLN